MNNVQKPSEVYLLVDFDDDPNGGGTHNNWPDAGNNHGEEGLNAGFLDGHAEWQRRGPGLIEMYLNGYADGAMQASEVWKFHPYLNLRTVGGITEWFYTDTPRSEGGRGR